MLEDLEKIERELTDLRRFGVGTMIDAMPLDAGRSVADLKTVSSRTGMHIVAATGLHLRIYYPRDHWCDTVDEDELTNRFIAEIEVGAEDFGVCVDGRTGVIKVASGLDRLSDLERRNFRAAGRAHVATGCPILTHTEQGTAALEQIQILDECGADLSRVVLSHLDRNGDLAYQREVLRTGVRLEYDSAFRWRGDANQTLDLLVALAPEFPDSFVVGMDAARFGYWRSFGGKPGLDFLVAQFAPRLLEAGLSQSLVDNIFIHNPANAYSFAVPNKEEPQE